MTHNSHSHYKWKSYLYSHFWNHWCCSCCLHQNMPSPLCNKLTPIVKGLLKGFLGNVRTDKLTRLALSKWRQKKKKRKITESWSWQTICTSVRLCNSDIFLAQHYLFHAPTCFLLSGSKWCTAQSSITVAVLCGHFVLGICKVGHKNHMLDINIQRIYNSQQALTETT